MKKISILTAILLSTFINSFATTYTWSATSAGSAGTSTNWSPNGVPAGSDNVIFDGTSVQNCTWNISVVNSFSVLSGYTGSITMSSGTRQIKQDIVINSGTVTSTSGSLIRSVAGVAGSFILGSGGTFNHNNGTFVLQLEGSDTYNFSGNIVLNNLTISGVLNTFLERSINFGSNLVASNVNYAILVGTPDPISYQGTIHIKNSLDLTASTNTDVLTGTNNANFIFDGAGAAITGASAAGTAFLPNIQINTTGSYSISNHLNLTGNWTWSQGTFVVGSSNVHFYGSSASISGTTPSFDNLSIESGGAVTMPSGELFVAKDLTQNGTLTAQSGSTLSLNGNTTGQTISGSGSSISVPVIHAYSGARTITLSKTTSVTDALIVNASVTFAAGGNLTLKSTNTLSARLAPLGSGASVTGNVTVETVIPGGNTGWANLGVPGVAGQTVGSWDTYVSSGGTTGIPMTCNGCAYSPSVLPSWFNSVQTWDEPTDSYDSVTVSTALTPGQGFWVYVGNGSTTTTDLKLVNTGTLVQGNVSYPVTASGSFSVDGGNFVYYNLVSNPYPSPISWGSVSSNNTTIYNAIYAYNADFGDFGSYVGNIGTNGMSDVQAAGQGFYIEASTAGSISFSESDKVTTSGTYPLLKPAASTNSVGQNFHLILTGASDKSETAIRVHGSATNGFDVQLDARKHFVSPGYEGYPGSYSKYTTLSTKDPFGGNYSIQSIPPLTQSVSLPLLARVSSSGTYTLHAFNFNDFNMCVGVYDHLNGTYHDLKQGDYAFSISDTTSAPRFDLILCRDESIDITGIAQQNVNSGAILINQDQQSAYVKTAFTQNTKALISVYNVIGQKLMNDIPVEGTVTTTRLPLELSNQIVLIRVATDKEIVTRRIITH